MIARPALAAAVLLAACAPALPATEAGPWRLQHLYGPGEPHEPFRFWLSASDLAAAEDRRPQLRHLMLNRDGGWSIIATEYRCDEVRVRRIEARGFDATGRQMHLDRYDDPPSPLSPITPEAVIHGIACGVAAAGEVEVPAVAAARAAEAEDHARYLATAGSDDDPAPVKPAAPPA